MISVNFSTVGQEPATSFEVAWNGAMDRAWVRQWQRPAPQAFQRRPEALQSKDVPLDRTSASSRFLAYLRAFPDGCHDSATVAEALKVSQNEAHAWLVRAHRRGIVEPRTVITRGGRPARVYRVVC